MSKTKLAEVDLTWKNVITNSSVLRQWIEKNEQLWCERPVTNTTGLEEDESYASSTLGDTRAIWILERRTSLEFVGTLQQIIWYLTLKAFSIWQRMSLLYKRIVFSVATKFYDPLGILVSFIAQFKVLSQQFCKSKFEWDQSLNRRPTQWCM